MKLGNRRKESRSIHHFSNRPIRHLAMKLRQFFNKNVLTSCEVQISFRSPANFSIVLTASLTKREREKCEKETEAGQVYLVSSVSHSLNVIEAPLLCYSLNNQSLCCDFQMTTTSIFLSILLCSSFIFHKFFLCIFYVCCLFFLLCR